VIIDFNGNNLTILEGIMLENSVLEDGKNSEIVVREDAKESILALKNAGLLKKLFPSPEYREYVKAELGIIKTELGFRQRALEIAKNGQIEEMRKRVNAWVAVQGVAIDKEKERQIRDLIKEREQEINLSIDAFLEDYLTAVEKNESMSNEKVKALETQRLDRVLVDFYGHIDFFKDEFDRSLKFSS
jgi:hypothetical protein